MIRAPSQLFYPSRVITWSGRVGWLLLVLLVGLWRLGAFLLIVMIAWRAVQEERVLRDGLLG